MFVEKRILDYDGCATLNGKKFVTLAGGCAPEASTLPPVTVSHILLVIGKVDLEGTEESVLAFLVLQFVVKSEK